ncbi:hypothetical protein ACWHAO_02565 [Streptomyces albidoflavus]
MRLGAADRLTERHDPHARPRQLAEQPGAFQGGERTRLHQQVEAAADHLVQTVAPGAVVDHALDGYPAPARTRLPGQQPLRHIREAHRLGRLARRPPGQQDAVPLGGNAERLLGL